MCAPAAAAAAPALSAAAPWLGVAQGVAGGLGAIGDFMGQSSAANAENKARLQAYQYQLAQRSNDWARTNNVWNSNLLDYKRTTASNYEAAGQAYTDEQIRLNEMNTEAAFSTQASRQQLARALGAAQASDVTGVSARRLANNLTAQQGFNDAIMADNLMRARFGYKQSTNRIRNQLMSANNTAYSKVAVQPMPTIAPPAPTMQAGPNPLGLVSGLAGSAISGFNTYADLQAKALSIPKTP